MNRPWYHVRLCSLIASAILLATLAQPASAPLAQASPTPVVPAADDDSALVRPALTNPIQDRFFYFVLPDRFDNGDPSNDFGGDAGGTSDADVLRHGFKPSDKGYYHGGDFKGLQGRLDYLQGMGVNAIWMTPIFKNRPVQGDGTIAGSSAAYHGYWTTDFTQVDPHFGTNGDLQTLIAAAHAKGMKVFFDIIANHTADVIDYAQKKYTYVDKSTAPYKDANGNPFDDTDYAGTDRFPSLSPEASFPYTPTFRTEADKTIKKPDWLNNPIFYHNRGNSTFSGENSTYGDFSGLDDLFTEQPFVAQGMTDIYKTWISDFGVDGYRIDTVKHVNVEFWQKFSRDIAIYARNHGKPDFFMYGEVYDSNPGYESVFTTQGGLPAVLDFGFQSSATSFANGGKSNNLRDFFAKDDYFTDADSNVYALPTFLGNHDMGRIGRFIQQANGSASPAELLARDQLAHALMFTVRGEPVVYSGDEQGFTGDGDDKDARQDMFGSVVPSYNDDVLIGTTATTASPSFNSSHPLYQSIKTLSALRTANKALQTGAQIHRYSADGPGVYAFSRIDRDEKVEYLVALNNATTVQTATLKLFAPNAGFTPLYPTGASPITTDANAQVTLAVPALSLVVYKANSALAASSAAPTVTITGPTANQQVTGRFEVGANLSSDALAEVTFAVKVGDGAYQVLGTDTNAPYRVFYDASNLEPGTPLTFKAIANDLSGHLSSSTVQSVVGIAGAGTCPPPAYAIIHYQRPAGDYDGWGLHLWGDAIDPSEATQWTSPKPFQGQDSYGRFAFIKLKDASKPVNFIVHKGDEKDTPEDRNFNPSETPEIFLKQGDAGNYPSAAAALGSVTVHYHRTGNDYAGWGLHLWGDAIDPSEATEWTSPKQPTGTDDYGVYFTIKLKDATKPVNFIVHNGDNKDTPDDRHFDPATSGQIWLTQGDAVAHITRSAAEKVAIIHYHRTAGDYGDPTSANFQDFWGLHVWTGALTPNGQWSTPIKPAGTDAFGIYFRVPLQPGATTLNYIMHRGDTKDQDQDQALNIKTYGSEVWVLQGAPGYLLPRVVTCDASANRNIVTAQAGGNFVSSDKSVQAIFPPQASGITLTLDYAKRRTLDQPLPKGTSLVRAFRLTALDDQLQRITQFALPYTLVITYTDAQLAVAGISDELSLAVAVSSGGPFTLPDGAVTSVDAVNNRITLKLNHLTSFAVVGTPARKTVLPVVVKQ